MSTNGKEEPGQQDIRFGDVLSTNITNFAKPISSTTLSVAKDYYRKLKFTRTAAHNNRIKAIMRETFH